MGVRQSVSRYGFTCFCTQANYSLKALFSSILKYSTSLRQSQGKRIFSSKPGPEISHVLFSDKKQASWGEGNRKCFGVCLKKGRKKTEPANKKSGSDQLPLFFRINTEELGEEIHMKLGAKPPETGFCPWESCIPMRTDRSDKPDGAAAPSRIIDPAGVPVLALPPCKLRVATCQGK